MKHSKKTEKLGPCFSKLQKKQVRSWPGKFPIEKREKRSFRKPQRMASSCLSKHRFLSSKNPPPPHFELQPPGGSHSSNQSMASIFSQGHAHNGNGDGVRATAARGGAEGSNCSQPGGRGEDTTVGGMLCWLSVGVAVGVCGIAYVLNTGMGF